MELFDQIWKLCQIIFIDLVLAGDNAIVIGLVAARFSPEYRRKVIFYGVGVAVLLRVLFALLATQLLEFPAVRFFGGLLLLWVCWKLWQDLRNPDIYDSPAEDTAQAPENPPLMAAIFQIIVADLSMSIDNVLAVAGVADGHTTLLVIGLAIAIIFMMFFATWIANILEKYRWIGYAGLLVILYVGAELVYEGYFDLLGLLNSHTATSLYPAFYGIS